MYGLQAWTSTSSRIVTSVLHPWNECFRASVTSDLDYYDKASPSPLIVEAALKEISLQTSEEKLQDLYQYYCGICGTEDGLMDFIILQDSVAAQFFWMDMWTFIIPAAKTDARDRLCTWGLLPWRYGLRVETWTDVLQSFSLLHSAILPNFCSQSSISLNCIWNYRSSYHSLTRLVCPALCILAVLSNPLVWTPVSLHFPH